MFWRGATLMMRKRVDLKIMPMSSWRVGNKRDCQCCIERLMHRVNPRRRREVGTTLFVEGAACRFFREQCSAKFLAAWASTTHLLKSGMVFRGCRRCGVGDPAF